MNLKIGSIVCRSGQLYMITDISFYWYGGINLLTKKFDRYIVSSYMNNNPEMFTFVKVVCE